MGHAATSRLVHHAERADGTRLILGRGHLEILQRLRVIYRHTNAAKVVHVADVPLAASVPPLGTELVRRYRSRVVDRHALAKLVKSAKEPSCGGVSLYWWMVRACEVVGGGDMAKVYIW